MNSPDPHCAAGIVPTDLSINCCISSGRPLKDLDFEDRCRQLRPLSFSSPFSSWPSSVAADSSRKRELFAGCHPGLSEVIEKLKRDRALRWTSIAF